jgi:hypothetical protein
MAQEEISTGQEDNTGSNGEQPPVKAPVGTDAPQLSPQEQARREEQSIKDKENAGGKEDLLETVDFLKARELERQRDDHVRQVLSDTDKYPNVKADDPLFKFAGSPEEVETIATTLQDRYKDMQQQALLSVREEPDVALTDEQIAERDQEREKTMRETGKSSFGSWLSDRQSRKN